MASTPTSTSSPFDDAISNTPMPPLSKQAIIWIAIISTIVLACMTAVALMMARGLCCHRHSTKKAATDNVIHSPLYLDQRNSYMAWKKWGGQSQVHISALPGSSLHTSSNISTREKWAKERQTGIVVPMQSFDFHPSSHDSAMFATKAGRLSLPVPVIIESDDGVAAPVQQRLQKGSRYYSGWPKIDRNSWRNSWRRSGVVIGRAL